MGKETPIRAIKGMNRDMTCRGYQFEVGKTYKGPMPVPCKQGFHACPTDDDTSPLAVFQYYHPAGNRFFEVECSGDVACKDDKVAAGVITIGAEVSVSDLIDRAIEWAGAKSILALNSGVRGAASNSGDYGAASNSGVRGAASNSGDYGAASNSGDRGAASNSGVSGVASNSGDYGAASNSGDRGAASNSGVSGVAMSHAMAGKVMCEGDGQALYASEIVYTDGKYVLKSNACGITGRDGIKACVWYQCKAGKLVECAA